MINRFRIHVLMTVLKTYDNIIAFDVIRSETSQNSTKTAKHKHAQNKKVFRLLRVFPRRRRDASSNDMYTIVTILNLLR